MTAEAGIAAAILRSDLYSFVRAAFPIVSPQDSFKPNWHIEAMAAALIRVHRGETKRLIITVPPRNLKSITASVAFPAFVLGHDPRHRIISVSYSESLARKHANDSRALMRSRLYRRLFPHTQISAKKDTEFEIATTRGGNRMATSLGGTLTGRGGNLIIIDDPMKPQDAYSEAARENVKQWYANTLLSRLDDKTKGAIVVVMQRLHVDDLVGYLLEQETWEHLNLPAVAESPMQVPLGPHRTHFRDTGDILHPDREPLPILNEFRKLMGSLDFAAQYQQEPVAPDGNLIKWKWFQFYNKPPPREPKDRIIVSWDTAMSGKELSSFSACVIMQVKGETVYLLDVIRDRLEYPDLRRKVLNTHRRWRIAANGFAMLIESKGSGMALIQDLKRDDIRPIAVTPEGEKLMRMNAQTARIEAGSVHLPTSAPWLDEFRRGLLAFPSSRYNDQVDAFSQGLNHAFSAKRGGLAVGFVDGLW